MDALPVNFGSLNIPENARGDGNNSAMFPKLEVNAAMRDLSEIIWKEGGFRFRHTATNSRNLTYQYHCSQDQAHAKAHQSMVETEKQRDGRRMVRFPCKSKLNMRPCFQDRTLSLSINHEWHIPYENIEMSSAIQDLINSRVATKTPAEICREIRGISEASTVTRHQVYYLWQKANAKMWQRDSDPLVSATMLLSENHDYRDHYGVFVAGNVRALGFFARQSIESLAGSARRQLVMDSTFGTNSSGSDLFAVLAEVEDTGVPLAYCLVDLPQDNKSASGKAHADPGAITNIIQQFLERLKAFGFDPKCFAIDKDQAEISAVTAVWPDAKVQLCYWHVKRAVSMKLKSSKSTKTQDHYHPEKAQELVPNLEICWGSLPVRRPVSHRFGECECPSKGERIKAEGRLEPAAKEERETVLEIVCRHFNLHSLIPDSNGTFKSPDTLHRECAAEMYTWCKIRGYYRLWAYMYSNWYRLDQWKRWARCADPAEIPVLKTTMILESHWRTLKHDYLHRFNRPRVDLVVWILTSRVIPDAVHRMEAILIGQFRVFKARWREEFKKTWKRAASKAVNPEKLKKHHTNPVNWTCACKSFLFSRFLLCKHIVYCFEPPTPEFFNTVQRQTTCPFWKDERLILRPEFIPSVELQIDSDTQDLQEDDAREPALDSSCESELDEDEESDDEGSDDEEAVPMEKQWAEFKKKMQDVMLLADEQAAKGNDKFVERFIASNQANCTLLEEVKSLRNKRTMARTWDRHGHPATMYFK